MRLLLRAKIHRGTVTDCNLDYEGSLGLGAELREAAGLLPLEQVSVLNISTGARLETYVIPSERKGEISLNGAAARHASPGDKVIILAYAAVPEDKISCHSAKIIVLGEGNNIVSSRTEKAV